LAAELKEASPGLEVDLIASSGGVFEVMMDGQLIYSKKQTHRHAEPGEVRKLLGL